MATIRNPSPFSLFSHALMRSLAAGEVVDGLTDEEAEAACSSGVFERGVLVEDTPEPARVRKARSTRGATEVEEATAEERETR